MPSLTIRDLSDETIRSLKARAAHHHSLNGEILHLFSTIAVAAFTLLGQRTVSKEVAAEARARAAKAEPDTRTGA